jgi:hypothetical protein
MNIANQVASILDKSYWVGANNTVYGIRLASFFPEVNTDFPYQIIVSVYQPSVSYLADTIQYPGNIDRQGIINWYDWSGQLVNDNNIIWTPMLRGFGDNQNPAIWTRTSLGPVRRDNEYDPKYIKREQTVFNNWFQDKYNAAYPYTPGTQGL